MKSLVAIVLTAALALASAAGTRAASLDPADASYLHSAMQAQLGRYALATLAQKQGSSAKVKQLAKQIAKQAGADTQTLDAIAKQNGIAPEKHPGVRDSYHYSQLSSLHGAEFDSRFVTELKIDDDIGSGNDKTQAQSGKNPALRAFAKRHGAMLASEMKTLSSMH
jgi:putative membrane protein